MILLEVGKSAICFRVGCDTYFISHYAILLMDSEFSYIEDKICKNILERHLCGGYIMKPPEDGAGTPYNNVKNPPVRLSREQVERLIEVSKDKV